MGLAQNMENTAKAEVQEVKYNKQQQDKIIYCHQCQEAFMAVRQAHSKPSVHPLRTDPNSLCADSSVSCRSCPTPVSDAPHYLPPSSRCLPHHTWIRQESKRNKHFCSCSINWGTSLGSHPSDASHILFEQVFPLSFSAIPQPGQQWVSSKNSQHLLTP